MDVVLTTPVNNGGSPIISYRVDGVPATVGRANITVTGLGKALSLTQVKPFQRWSNGRGCCPAVVEWQGLLSNGGRMAGVAASGP